MQKIQILIAAHKISELPKNSLFLPVEVGAANRKVHLPGYQRDDAGDNISAKNPNYCELTAIYWGWKNLDCDYCGIMHYRRFFSFTDTRYPVSRDGRKMIRWPAATKERYEEFGLLDEAKMRQIIEDNDLIVAESQNVKEICTPLGKRRSTVEKHYIDHEDCIIKMADLNLALDIAKQKYPKVAPYINKYMHQKMYLGYNMWIAKKPIYDEICDFMFSVLKEVETKVDIRYYNTQMARIYGYLAEVLSSAYIYYLRQTRNYKVNERQMIYIEDTNLVGPIAPSSKNVCPIIFDLTVPVKTRYLSMFFLPCLENFLEHTNKKNKYDAIIFYNNDISPITEKSLAEITKLGKKYPHCNIRLVELSLELARNNQKFSSKKSLLQYIDKLSFGYDKMLYFKWSTIINSDPAELYKIKVDQPIGAVVDLITEGKINQYKSAKLKYINEHNISRDDIFALDVMVLNIKKLKELKGEGQIEDIYRKTYAGAWTKLPTDWNCQAPTYANDEYIKTLAPAADFADPANAKVVSFQFKNVQNASDRAFFADYFNLAKQSPIFACYLSLLFATKKTNYENNMVLTDTFPVGSPKRELLSKMFPHGTRRRNLINKILKVFLRG